MWQGAVLIEKYRESTGQTQMPVQALPQGLCPGRPNVDGAGPCPSAAGPPAQGGPAPGAPPSCRARSSTPAAPGRGQLEISCAGTPCPPPTQLA